MTLSCHFMVEGDAWKKGRLLSEAVWKAQTSWLPIQILWVLGLCSPCILKPRGKQLKLIEVFASKQSQCFVHVLWLPLRIKQDKDMN